MTSAANTTSTISTERGLTSAEAAELLRTYGPNAVSEPRSSPVVGFLRKLSGPVPWMLQATLVIELVLRKPIEAGIIVGLLVLNATVSFVQERRAHDALALLRTKMHVTARVQRDGIWRIAPAEELVPGDLVHVRMGDILPADLHISDGGVLLDESSLTGESMPVEHHAGEAVYSGAIVRRGEATGRVVATGTRSYFGKTAELVRLAKTESHIEALVVRIVKYLVAIDAILATLVIADAFARRATSAHLLPFVLMLLVASVPVALPAMFSLATTLGASELAGCGALVTRLSAIEDAAAMDVLCSDKTGTLTQNQLSLSAVVACPAHMAQELLELAAYACDEAAQDPLDLAILRARGEDHEAAAWTPGTGVRPPGPGFQLAAERVEFIPFDPATKRAEAVIRRGTEVLRIIKGAPQAVVELTRSRRDISIDVARLAERGDRVLAVAAGPEGGVEMIGLLGFRDSPREDASGVIRSLHELGVRVLMVTGDAPATAHAVARELDIGDRVCSRNDVEANALGCNVFAGVLPEDKIHLVRALRPGWTRAPSTPRPPPRGRR